MMHEQTSTLRQGLDVFYTEYKDHLSHTKKDISQEAKTFFKSHDVAHVLFGCDISLFGEGSVKLWTIFGTTLGFWKHISGYKEANAYELSKNFNLVQEMPNVFKFVLSIPILIVRAKRMSKPWPWTNYEAYLDTPISEIRREFNIEILS